MGHGGEVGAGVVREGCMCVAEGMMGAGSGGVVEKAVLVHQNYSTPKRPKYLLDADGLRFGLDGGQVPLVTLLVQLVDVPRAGGRDMDGSALE